MQCECDLAKLGKGLSDSLTIRDVAKIVGKRVPDVDEDTRVLVEALKVRPR